MNKNKLSVGLLTIAFVMVMGSAFATPVTTPDAASTGVLMSLGIAGIAAAKRFMR